MEQTDNTNKDSVKTTDYIGKSAYNALYRRIKKRIDGLVETIPYKLKEWATSMFVQSVNGKIGSEITIDKADVGLGNVDNTPDTYKHVAHAITADNADKIDGNHAADFMTKNEHKEYESSVDTAIADLDERKVDKEIGKGLSTNDFTNEYLHKIADVEEGAQKNTVTSVACKTGNVIIVKDDVGLGNVDNTADKDKYVAHANTAGDSDTLDGKHASAFMLKTDHEEYELVIAQSLTDLDARKVDKVDGKGLSTNDYTTSDKNKLDGIETGSQKNTVTSVAGKTGAVTLNINDIICLQTALDKKQDNLPFTSAPTSENKVVTQNELKVATSGASNYLGTIESVYALSTTARKGDFYRVKTAWSGVHVGDIIIAEKDNPSATIDDVNWSLLHNEVNTDTTYTFKDGVDGFKVTPSVGTEQKVNVQVKKVNGHTVDANVPANAVFTDTVIDNVQGDGIALSGNHNEVIALNNDTKNVIANAKTDHTNLGGHTVGKDVPSNALFTDYQATKAGHYTPTEQETTINPDTSVLRDTTRDMAFVGAVKEDEKRHVTAIETCAIFAFTDAEIQSIINETTAQIAAEMA